MTAVVARPPVDPDLTQALEELAGPVALLMQLDEGVVAMRLSADQGNRDAYRAIGPAERRRADLLNMFNDRARRCHIKGRTMRLFAEEYARLRHVLKRRPSLAQLQTAVIHAREVLKRERLEREALMAFAELAKMQAVEADAAGDEAVQYLEACRG